MAKTVDLLEKYSDIVSAASSGNKDAMYELATLCYTYASSPRPLLLGYESAKEWAEKALAENHVWAATLLGHLYSNANYSGSSREKALHYYRMGSDMGHTYASECLENLVADS